MKTKSTFKVIPENKQMTMEKDIIVMKNSMMQLNLKIDSLNKIISNQEEREIMYKREIKKLEDNYKSTFIKENNFDDLEKKLKLEEREIKQLNEKIEKMRNEHKEELLNKDKHYSLEISSLKNKLETLNKRLEATEILEKENLEFEEQMILMQKELKKKKKFFDDSLKSIEIAYYLKHDYFKDNIIKAFDETKKLSSKLQVQFMDSHSKMILLQNQKINMENEYLYDQMHELFLYIKQLDMKIADYKNTIETMRIPFVNHCQKKIRNRKVRNKRSSNKLNSKKQFSSNRSSMTNLTRINDGISEYIGNENYEENKNIIHKNFLNNKEEENHFNDEKKLHNYVLSLENRDSAINVSRMRNKSNLINSNNNNINNYNTSTINNNTLDYSTYNKEIISYLNNLENNGQEVNVINKNKKSLINSIDIIETKTNRKYHNDIVDFYVKLKNKEISLVKLKLSQLQVQYDKLDTKHSALSISIKNHFNKYKDLVKILDDALYSYILNTHDNKNVSGSSITNSQEVNKLLSSFDEIQRENLAKDLIKVILPLINVSKYLKDCTSNSNSNIDINSNNAECVYLTTTNVNERNLKVLNYKFNKNNNLYNSMLFNNNKKIDNFITNKYNTIEVDCLSKLNSNSNGNDNNTVKTDKNTSFSKDNLIREIKKKYDLERLKQEINLLDKNIINNEKPNSSDLDYYYYSISKQSIDSNKYSKHNTINYDSLPTKETNNKTISPYNNINSQNKMSILNNLKINNKSKGVDYENINNLCFQNNQLTNKSQNKKSINHVIFNKFKIKKSNEEKIKVIKNSLSELLIVNNNNYKNCKSNGNFKCYGDSSILYKNILQPSTMFTDSGYNIKTSIAYNKNIIVKNLPKLNNINK